MSFVHEALVPSQFVADAIRTENSAFPVHILPHPLAVDTLPNLLPGNTKDELLTVLMISTVASGFARKNPLAGIAAFRRAYGPDKHVRLIVKASHLDAYEVGST